MFNNNWRLIYVIILLSSIATYLILGYLIYELYTKVSRAIEVLEVISAIRMNYSILKLEVFNLDNKLSLYSVIVFNIYLNKTIYSQGPVIKLLFNNEVIAGFTIDYLNVSNIAKTIEIRLTIDREDVDKPIYIYAEMTLDIGKVTYRNIFIYLSDLIH